MKQEGGVALAVRNCFDDLKDKPYNDPQFRAACAMTKRAMDSLENDDYDHDDNEPPPVKKKRFRAEGGGRKTQASEFRNELFGWFVDIRFALKGRLPKWMFIVEAKKLYQKWLKDQSEEVPPEKQLKFSELLILLPT